jgi:hypothetical protein
VELDIQHNWKAIGRSKSKVGFGAISLFAEDVKG